MAYTYEVYFAVRKPVDTGLAEAAKRFPPVRHFPVGLRAIHQVELERPAVRFHPDSCGRGDKVARRQHLDELDA